MRMKIFETVLEKRHVGYRYEEYVPLDRINASKGMKNQARLEPIDKDLVTHYAQLMKEGHEFPALVLWRPGQGMYIPVDGNHRLAAKIINKDNGTDAYTLDSHDEVVADRLTKIFNILVNGKRLTAEETLHHAMSDCRKYSIPATQAAKEWGVSYSHLQNKLKVANLKDILSINKIPVSTSLSERALLNLAPLNKVGEDLFLSAAKIVTENGFSHEGASDLTIRVLKGKSYKDKLDILKEVKESQITKDQKIHTKGGKTHYELPRDKIARALRTLRDLLDQVTDLKTARPVGPAFKSTQEEAFAVINKLIPLYLLGRLLDSLEEEAG